MKSLDVVVAQCGHYHEYWLIFSASLKMSDGGEVFNLKSFAQEP